VPEPLSWPGSPQGGQAWPLPVVRRSHLEHLSTGVATTGARRSAAPATRWPVSGRAPSTLVSRRHRTMGVAGGAAGDAVHVPLEAHRYKCRSRPVSRVLFRGMLPAATNIHLGHALPRASSGLNPEASSGPLFAPPRGGAASLFALAPGGVCRAAPVTGSAVRSYRTLSPLPRAPRGAVRRSALCGTFLRVAPTGR
jgi:hypothetical protein